jgi:hypothetical protein
MKTLQLSINANFLRHVLTAIVMCLGIIFPSCGHDDEPNNPYEEETPNYSDTDNTGSGSSGGSSSGGSGGTSYEKPDIGFYDFTATKTSLKVQYQIYNKDEAKVTSAKIYYRTSSNPSTSKTATIAGRIITANISGLKAGTTYYVKCTATGKGGSTTTSVTKCITNY